MSPHGEDIMANDRHAANRKNALKSTGPKTPFGKAVASRNAVKHGDLHSSSCPLGIEVATIGTSTETGVVKSIAAVVYLEELLTLRLAILSWRLWRVVRYEAEVATAALARTEADMDERGEDGYQTARTCNCPRESS